MKAAHDECVENIKEHITEDEDNMYLIIGECDTYLKEIEEHICATWSFFSITFTFCFQKIKVKTVISSYLAHLYLKWTWKTDLALNLGNFLFHKCFVDKRLGHFSPNNTRSVT